MIQVTVKDMNVVDIPEANHWFTDLNGFLHVWHKDVKVYAVFAPGQWIAAQLK